MKRKLISSVIVLSMLALSACGKGESGDIELSEEMIEDIVADLPDDVTDGELPTEDEERYLGISDQIECFVQSVDAWWPEEDVEITYGITVTDLDHNGQAELILAESGNSGNYTTSLIYEVNMDYTTLDKLEYNYSNRTDEFEEPDIIKDEVRMYLKDGKYYYIFDDLTKDGYAYFCNKKLAVCKSDYEINVDTLGFLEAQDDGDGDEPNYSVKVTDANGNPSDLETYRNADLAAFSDAEVSVATIKWEYISNKDEITNDLLNSLYQGFTIKDGDGANIIYCDPANMEVPYEVID